LAAIRVAKSLVKVQLAVITLIPEPIWVLDLGDGRHCSYSWEAGSLALSDSIRRVSSLMTWPSAEECGCRISHTRGYRNVDEDKEE